MAAGVDVNLELGGGPSKLGGFVSIDVHPWDGATDIIYDLSDIPWPIDDSSVDELYSCHLLEHLSWQLWPGCKLTNEMYRIMKPGAKMMHIWPEPARLLNLLPHACMCVDFKTFEPNPDCPKCGGHGRVHPLRVKTDLCGDQDVLLGHSDVHKNILFEHEFAAYVVSSGFKDVRTYTHARNIASCVLTARKPE